MPRSPSPQPILSSQSLFCPSTTQVFLTLSSAVRRIRDTPLAESTLQGFPPRPPPTPPQFLHLPRLSRMHPGARVWGLVGAGWICSWESCREGECPLKILAPQSSSQLFLPHPHPQKVFLPGSCLRPRALKIPGVGVMLRAQTPPIAHLLPQSC